MQRRYSAPAHMWLPTILSFPYIPFCHVKDLKELEFEPNQIWHIQNLQVWISCAISRRVELQVGRIAGTVRWWTYPTGSYTAKGKSPFNDFSWMRGLWAKGTYPFEFPREWKIILFHIFCLQKLNASKMCKYWL